MFSVHWDDSICVILHRVRSLSVLNSNFNTFWYTELNFGLFLSHEGSIWLSPNTTYCDPLSPAASWTPTENRKWWGNTCRKILHPRWLGLSMECVTLEGRACPINPHLNNNIELLTLMNEVIIVGIGTKSTTDDLHSSFEHMSTSRMLAVPKCITTTEWGDSLLVGFLFVCLLDERIPGCSP